MFTWMRRSQRPNPALAPTFPSRKRQSFRFSELAINVVPIHRSINLGEVRDIT